MSIKFWEGPSEINGAIVMAYLSGEISPSTNRKTGPALQVGVMLKDMHPSEAAKTGDDFATCGDCQLRPSIHKAAKAEGNAVGDDPCYVKLFFKGAQHKSLVKSKCKPKLAQAYVEDADFVRFGEYGNMSAIPREVIEPMLKSAKKWTLYEHEWRRPENQWLRYYALASVHSTEERLEAKSMGWRTFRIINPGEGRVSGEIVCPYVTHEVQCIGCGLCNGADGVIQALKPTPYIVKDIAIPSH